MLYFTHKVIRPVTSVTLPADASAGYVSEVGFCGRSSSKLASKSATSRPIHAFGESGESEGFSISGVTEFAILSGRGRGRAIPWQSAGFGSIG
jgi:hypothetical protein